MTTGGRTGQLAVPELNSHISRESMKKFSLLTVSSYLLISLYVLPKTTYKGEKEMSAVHSLLQRLLKNVGFPDACWKQCENIEPRHTKQLI